MSEAILLAGASGLVGGNLAQLLADRGLICIGRNPATYGQQLVGPVSDWPRLISAQKLDVVMCALGTTIKVAGSKAGFEAIDLHLVRDVAVAARAAGARRFLLVSSVGANPDSSNFYLSVKGKAEAAVQQSGFERVDIFRPGLLLGNRAQSRPGEGFAKMISPITDALTPRRWDRYRSTEAETVATAMVRALDASDNGVFIHHNREMADQAPISA